MAASRKENWVMENRPILVATDNGVCPAVPDEPTLAAPAGAWRGFGMEDLHLSAGELPPQATLLQHVICTVSCPEPLTVHWRENGEHYQTVHHGDLFLRSQQELVDFCWDKPMDVLVLGVGIDTFRSLSSEDRNASAFELQPRFNLQDPFLRRMMLALREDLRNNSPTGPLLGESICLSIASYALQNYSVHKHGFMDYQRGLSPQSLKLVLDYIEANLGAALSIRGLAEGVGVPLHYFRKLFLKSTGFTVHEYVLRARIARAQQLLKGPHLEIAKISREVGFSSQSHLTAEFRRRLGVTPAVYRAMVAPSRVQVATSSAF